MEKQLSFMQSDLEGQLSMCQESLRMKETNEALLNDQIKKLSEGNASMQKEN